MFKLVIALLFMAGCAATPPKETIIRNNALGCTIEPLIPCDEMGELVSEYALRLKVPELVVHRIVKAQSNYDANFKRDGRLGLMGLTLEQAKEAGFMGKAADLLNPEVSLIIGITRLNLVTGATDGNHDPYYDCKKLSLFVEKLGSPPKCTAFGRSFQSYP